MILPLNNSKDFLNTSNVLKTFYQINTNLIDLLKK